LRCKVHIHRASLKTVRTFRLKQNGLTGKIHTFIPKDDSLIHTKTNTNNYLPKAESMNVTSPLFWDVALCNPLEVNQHFGRTCRLHLRGRFAACYLLQSGLVLGFFDIKDGGDMFLRNICWFSTKLHGKVSQRIEYS
jgi:hypothetical protein